MRLGARRQHSLVMQHCLVIQSCLVVLHHLVRFAGGRCTGVASTQQGLECLIRAPFDLVVSDYNRPGSHGVTFLAACRVLHPEIPLMLYSGAMPLTAVRRAICMHGVERAYWKPADVQRLVAVMSGLARAQV